VYAEGEEPDPRFTFANERTFLAWVRTSLALMAAGVALDAFSAGLPAGARKLIAVVLLAVGVACACWAYLRWMANERALRRGDPLPGFAVGALVCGGVVLAAVAVLALVALR
jgi:putative membrane protein